MGEHVTIGPELHLTVRSFSYDRPPSDKLLQSMAELNGKLVIDRSVPGPQKGFGRAVSANEMRPWFTSPDIRLYTLELNDAFVGYFTFFNGPHQWPILPELTESLVNSRPFTNPGWFEIVGIDHEARTILKRDYHVSGYETLLRAAVDSARDFNVDSIFCQVREGDNANLSKANHLAAGFQETPIEFTECGMQYRVLFMDLHEQVDRQVLKRALGESGTSSPK